MIVGEADIADVRAFSGAIQAALPVVRREVWKDCGHLIQLEKPGELIARLETFIAMAGRKTIPFSASILQRYKGTYSFLPSRSLGAPRENFQTQSRPTFHSGVADPSLAAALQAKVWSLGDYPCCARLWRLTPERRNCNPGA